MSAPEMNEPVLHNVSEALARAKKIGYPVLVIPRYTLRGAIPDKDLIARTEEELKSVAMQAFTISPTGEIRLLKIPFLAQVRDTLRSKP